MLMIDVTDSMMAWLVGLGSAIHVPCVSAPAQAKPSPDTPQIPPWLHRTIMILFVLLALIFSFCIILSTLVLVKSK